MFFSNSLIGALAVIVMNNLSFSGESCRNAIDRPGALIVVLEIN